MPLFHIAIEAQWNVTGSLLVSSSLSYGMDTSIDWHYPFFETSGGTDSRTVQISAPDSPCSLARLLLFHFHSTFVAHPLQNRFDIFPLSSALI
jgi:hypothetical protein